jgi:cardiolipin synthase A/B
MTRSPLVRFARAHLTGGDRGGPDHRHVVRRGQRHLAPNPRADRPKGRPAIGKRLRQLVWLWWGWAVLSIAFTIADEWGWAATTGLMAGVSFLVMPSERPPQFGLDHEFAVSDPEFLPTMIGATGESPIAGNRVSILNNGDEFYPAMLEAIRNAKRSVTIEAYIYWDGEIGKEVATALVERSRAGLPVKILLDAIGSASIGQEILTLLEAGRCQVAWYNPTRWYSLGRLNHRTHRKSLIIDGLIAFTGGAGIADHWRGTAQDSKHWRDIQIRVEGPAARPLQTGFAHNWVQATGELVSGERFYPTAAPSGDLSAFAIMSSPEAGASSVRTMYYLSIVCARRSIYIANPYFVPDEVAVAALRDAKRRGVDVQIMLSGRHNDAWLARQNSVRLYGALLREGIVIMEYNRTMLHQKTMVVDGLWGTVGTTNFDNRSFAHNEENNICVYDRDWATALEQIFHRDAQVCDRVDLETWRRRGVTRKAEEFVAAFLEDQV